MVIRVPNLSFLSLPFGGVGGGFSSFVARRGVALELVRLRIGDEQEPRRAFADYESLYSGGRRANPPERTALGDGHYQDVCIKHDVHIAEER